MTTTLLPMALSLVVNMTSHHWVNEEENERNWGLGLQADRWAAGYFLNSTQRDSWYAAYTFRRRTAWGEYGALVGGVTGYDHKPWAEPLGPVTPLVAPYLRVGWLQVVQLGDATGIQLRFTF